MPYTYVISKQRYQPLLLLNALVCFDLALELAWDLTIEIFQWLDPKQALELNQSKQEHLKEEVADIAVYLLRMCMAYDINLEEAIVSKMKKNEIKYPLVDDQGCKIVYGRKN